MDRKSQGRFNMGKTHMDAIECVLLRDNSVCLFSLETGKETTMTDKVYSREDAQHIAQQLEAVADLSGAKLFTRVEVEEHSWMYTVFAEMEANTAVIQLRKYPKGKEPPQEESRLLLYDPTTEKSYRISPKEGNE